MKNRNCPNCGAPYEINKYKCPYCGTLYLDLSMINFDEREPLFLTIKKDGMLLTQKVIPETATFESTSEDVYITGGLHNNRLACFTTGINIETNIQFIAVPMSKDKKIYAEMRHADETLLDGC